MKKIGLLFSIVSFVICFPFMAMAKGPTSCEKVSTGSEKTVEIKVKQDINNKDQLSKDVLKKAIFSYKILDLDDNVLAETKSDSEGNVIFDCFNVKASDLRGYKIYKIVMEDNANIPFDYDSNIVYFSLRPDYTDGLFNPIVAYYRDDGNDSPVRYNTPYKGKVFHASEEELQGTAYAVLDKTTGVMTFFRDEPGKYTNKQEDGNKIYYTGFEEHQNKNWYSAWNGGWRDDYVIRPYIKKIVFEDAVRPNNITGWFENLSELEELNIGKLDTSLLTGIDFFLLGCPKVKSVDISTFDASNVNSMFKSFNNTSVEYLNFTSLNLDQSLSRMQLSEFVLDNNNLKYLNISNFGDWSSSGEITNLPCLEKIVINDTYDFSRGNIDGRGPQIWYNPRKNRLFTNSEMHNILYNHSESMAGYYIRPMCTTNASFIIKYNSSKIKNPIINPKTEGSVLIVVVFIALFLGFWTFIYKKRIFRY